MKCIKDIKCTNNNVPNFENLFCQIGKTPSYYLKC